MLRLCNCATCLCNSVVMIDISISTLRNKLIDEGDYLISSLTWSDRGKNRKQSPLEFTNHSSHKSKNKRKLGLVGNSLGM